MNSEACMRACKITIFCSKATYLSKFLPQKSQLTCNDLARQFLISSLNVTSRCAKGCVISCSILSLTTALDQ